MQEGLMRGATQRKLPTYRRKTGVLHTFPAARLLPPPLQLLDLRLYQYQRCRDDLASSFDGLPGLSAWWELTDDCFSAPAQACGWAWSR